MSFNAQPGPFSLAFSIPPVTGGSAIAMHVEEFVCANARAAQDSRRSRVFVVDPHPFVRESVVCLLNRQPDLICCGDAETMAEAARGMEKQLPDLLLLDLQLGDGSALDLIEFLRPQFPRLVILVLSHCNEVALVERALRAGANGYLLKQDACEQMLEAIRALLIGKLYVSQDVAGRMLTKLLKLPVFPQNRSC